MTKKNDNVVTLETEIKRGDTTIKTIEITGAMKQAGSMRGLKLYDVMTSDVDALIVLLPRVTQPALTEFEVSCLSPWDFAQLSTKVANFLQPSAGVKGTQTER